MTDCVSRMSYINGLSKIMIISHDAYDKLLAEGVISVQDVNIIRCEHLPKNTMYEIKNPEEIQERLFRMFDDRPLL